MNEIARILIWIMILIFPFSIAMYILSKILYRLDKKIEERKEIKRRKEERRVRYV